MSSKQLFVSLLVGWTIAVASGLATRVSFSPVGLSAFEYAGWIFLASAPVFTAVILARGRATRSIAHVLYDAEQAGDSRQPQTVKRG